MLNKVRKAEKLIHFLVLEVYDSRRSEQPKQERNCDGNLKVSKRKNETAGRLQVEQRKIRVFSYKINMMTFKIP